jgi:HPt (histidine-containing phosphotransfer) domain-containing protein
MGDAVEQLEKQMADVDKLLHDGLSTGRSEEESGIAVEQASGEDGSASLNFAAGLAVVGGDREIYLIILKTFLEDHGGNCVEIEQSLENGDFQHAADLLHTLKGVTPAIGALRLADITKRFNDLLVSSDRENLSAVLAEMQLEFPLVLDAISSVLEIESNRNTADISVAVDVSDMKERAEELSLLIKNMDMAAGEYAATFTAQLEAQGFLEIGEADALREAIHDFDFERASEELAFLRRKIEKGAFGGVE